MSASIDSSSEIREIKIRKCRTIKFQQFNYKASEKKVGFKVHGV